jgi:hypothetical protein
MFVDVSDALYRLRIDEIRRGGLHGPQLSPPSLPYSPTFPTNLTTRHPSLRIYGLHEDAIYTLAVQFASHTPPSFLSSPTPRLISPVSGPLPGPSAMQAHLRDAATVTRATHYCLFARMASLHRKDGDPHSSSYFAQRRNTCKLVLATARRLSCSGRDIMRYE